MDGPRFPSQIANIGWVGFSSPLCSTCITLITMHKTQPARLFQHNKGCNAWDLPMADNGTVLLTHKHIGTQAVRFYFSLTGVKGLMEGLNKLCFILCPCT